jgi:hypothetical protein
MMCVLTDVGAELIAAGHCTAATLFYGCLPNSPVNCVMIKVYGGEKDDLLGYEYPRFQVQVRNSNQQTAATLIHAIRATLTKTNATLSGTWYPLCQALHSPAQMSPESDSGIVKWYCDFKVIKKILGE